MLCGLRHDAVVLIQHSVDLALVANFDEDACSSVGLLSRCKALQQRRRQAYFHCFMLCW